MGELKKRYEEAAAEMREYLVKDRPKETPVGAWFRGLADLQSKLIELEIDVLGAFLDRNEGGDMGKSIKEKARIAWERDLEVVITPKVGNFYTPHDCCRIETLYQSGVNLIWSEEGEVTRQPMSYIDIADIRFVGEPEGALLREATPDELGAENEALRKTIATLEERLTVAEATDEPEDTTASDGVTESFKDKLEAAMLSKQPVSVEWQHGNGHGVVEGIVYETMLNGFKFKDDDRKHDYMDITSIEPLDEQPDEPEDIVPTMTPPYCNQCGNMKDGPFLQFDLTSTARCDSCGVFFYIKVNEEETRLHNKPDEPEDIDGDIAVTGTVTKSHVDRGTHTPTQAAEPGDPADNTIAKQRWEVEVLNDTVRIINPDGKIRHLVEDLGSATDAQMDLMAAAPELADKLRNMVDGCTDGHIAPSPGVVAEAVTLLHSLGVKHVDDSYQPDLIANARQTMREGFANDPEWKQTYIANIAKVMWDNCVLDSDSKRNEMAEKILDRVFEK